MSGLTLKNINKTFPGDQQAIRDFNLEVKDREFLHAENRHCFG